MRQIADVRIALAQLAALLALIDDKTINPNTGKKVLDIMYATGDDPARTSWREGLAKMVSDTSVIDEAVASIPAGKPRRAWRYRGGETKLFGFSWGR